MNLSSTVIGSVRMAERIAIHLLGMVIVLRLIQPIGVIAQSSTSDAKVGQFPVFRHSHPGRGTYSPLVIEKDGRRFHIDLNDQPWEPGEGLLRTQLRGLYDESATVLGIAWFVDGREPVVVSVDFRRFQARLNYLTEDQRRALNIRFTPIGSFTTLSQRGWKNVFDLGRDGVILLPMGDPAFPESLRSSGPVLVEYGVTELRHEIDFLKEGVARAWDPIKGVSELAERQFTQLLRSERLVVYEVDPWRAKPTYEAALFTDDGRRVSVELAERGEKMAAEFLDGWRGPRIRAN